MMKTILKSSFISSALGLGVLFFLFPTTSFAQSAPLILMQQSQISSTTSPVSNVSVDYIAQLGNGFQGSSTEAFITATYNKTGGNSSLFSVVLGGYSDSSYSSNVQLCEFDAPSNSSSFSGPGYVQLNYANGDCFLNANRYYNIQVKYNTNTSFVNNLKIFGIDSVSPSWNVSTINASNSGFFPQFVVTGGNFFITPTASSSGIFLSGAVDFCNSALGTTTSFFDDPAASFSKGLCISLGFLFVPTPLSLQQFQDFNLGLQTKVPFSYVYGVNGIYGVLVASSTENLPSYGIDFPNFTASSSLGTIIPSHIDYFSTTTISKYYPDFLRESFLTLGAWAIWIFALYSVYRRIAPNKATI